MSSSNLTDPEVVGATPPPLPAPAPAAAYRRPPKNPALAALLSLFPGLGQLYNGHTGKAFSFFGAWVAAIYATATIDPLPFAFLIPFVYLYNLIDAYKSAAAINARALGGVVEEEATGDVESPVWGGTLIAVGAVLLFHNLGWLDLSRLQRYWPVLLIAVGGYLLYGSIQKRKDAETGDGGRL
jgi:TM2 domain-containing membrane protein YozV